MTLKAIVLSLLALPFAPACRAQVLSPPPIKAASAILVDAVSGQVLYEKDADIRRPPASTTKIMTAIMLIEHLRPEETITASKAAEDTEGSALHLKAGEQISARDMLYALMLRSANDGCVAVAEKIAGSEGKFAEMMTAKAREIGATNTVFNNSNGLNEHPNLTTARDLALMARYASRYPEFNEATSTKFYTLRRSTASKDVLLKNHAKFLWKFPGADGIKTGYTVPAGHCFVGAATWHGWRLISVVMKSPDIFGETHDLLKYGFDQFEPHLLAEKGKVYATAPVKDGRAASIELAASQPLQYVTRKGDMQAMILKPEVSPIEAPIASGAPAGKLEAVVNGQIVASTDLVAVSAVERAPATTMSSLGGGSVAAGLFCALVIGSGTAITKTARRRGYRLTSLVRGLYRRG